MEKDNEEATGFSHISLAFSVTRSAFLTSLHSQGPFPDSMPPPAPQVCAKDTHAASHTRQFLGHRMRKPNC